MRNTGIAGKGGGLFNLFNRCLYIQRFSICVDPDFDLYQIRFSWMFAIIWILMKINMDSLYFYILQSYDLHKPLF